MPTQNTQDLLAEHYIKRGTDEPSWHQSYSWSYKSEDGNSLVMFSVCLLIQYLGRLYDGPHRGEETEVVQRRHQDVQ